MGRPPIFKDVVIDALKSKGGEADLAFIYDYVQKHYVKIRTAPDYQHSVRRVLAAMKKSGELLHVGQARYKLRNH